MAEKQGAKKKSGGKPAGSGRKVADDRDVVIARLNERIAALETDLQEAREDLQARQEELEVQTEELETHLEGLNAANETLEKEVQVRRQSEEALRKSQFILAKSQEMAHVGNWAWNVATGEMKWSEESFRIFGFRPHQVKTGWEWMASRVHLDDRALLTGLSAAVREGKGADVDIRVHLPDGTVRYVNVLADKVVRDKAGQVRHAYGIFQDITERKRMEADLREKMEEVEVQAEELESQNEELRANYEELNNATRRLHDSETLLRSVTDTSPDAIFVKDRDCCIVLANPATLQVIGKPPEKVIGKCDTEFYDDQAIGEAIVANDRRIMKSGKTEVVEELAQTPDGYRVFLSSKTPLRNDRGEITGIMGIARDITERKRDEDRIRKQAALIDLSPDGIIVRKMDGTITFWSKGAETLYGWTKGEAIGQQTHTLFETQFPKPLDEIIEELQLTGRWSGELVHRTKDGREITVQSSWLGQLDEKGGIAEILESNVDITALKQVQKILQEKIEVVEVQAEELESQNEELRANYDQLNLFNRSLEESNAKLEAVFASMNDGVCIMDASQNIVSVNEAFARFHRFDSKESYVRAVNEYGDFLQLYAPDGKLMPMEDWPILRGFRGETASNFEVLLKRTDTGAEWYGNYSYAPIRDNAGKIIGSVLTMRDITWRKQADEALRASEVRFRSLIQNSSDIIRIIDRNGLIVYDSPSSEKILGYPPGSTIGKSPLDFIHPDDRQRISRELNSIFTKTNPGTPSEFRIRKADGSYLDVESVGVNMIGTPGVEGIVTTTRPITERKRAEEALRKNESMLRQIIDSSPVPMVLYNESENYYYYNRKFSETFGYTVRDVPTIHDWWQRAYPDEQYRESVKGRWYDAVGEAIKNKSSITPQEVEVTCKDGSKRYVLNAFSSIGEVNLSVLYDITGRRQAEEALKEAKQQAELYLDLMGHDISNMHQIALSQLELAEDILKVEGKIGIADTEMITTPIETLQRSAKLIDNVRKLQKLRAGEYRIENVDLGRVLDEIVREHTVLGNGVTINYTQPGDCLVKANPLIKEAFANLVSNAIKHSHGMPTIDVGVSKVSEGGTAYHRISIADYGPGIPDDKKEEIFHRFKRGQTHARGTGLGLYIVKTLVENFGGRVRVENRVPGNYTKGSKFIVDLPIAEDYHE